MTPLSERLQMCLFILICWLLHLMNWSNGDFTCLQPGLGASLLSVIHP